MKQGFRWGSLKTMVNISHIVLLQPFSFLSVIQSDCTVIQTIRPSLIMQNQLLMRWRGWERIYIRCLRGGKNDGKGSVHDFPPSFILHSGLHLMTREEKNLLSKMVVVCGGKSYSAHTHVQWTLSFFILYLSHVLVWCPNFHLCTHYEPPPPGKSRLAALLTTKLAASPSGWPF